MPVYRQYLVAVLILLLTCIPKLQADELKVAVASNFYHSLSELIQQTEFAEQLKLSSGSTGLLYAQLRKGAPFDVFLSADSERPKLLNQQGLAYQPKTYAIGKLVLWPAVKNAQYTLQDFTGKLAVANPKLAPYGQAAIETLTSLSLRKQYQSRLIKANNINQAFQFVDSGNAKLALLAKAQLVQAKQKVAIGKQSKYENYQEIPSEWHQPVAQQMVILQRTKELALAQRFQAWLLSDKVQKKLIAAGYERQK